MYKIRIAKDDITFKDHPVYNAYIDYYEKGKNIYTIGSARNMIYKKDAKKIAMYDIEYDKLRKLNKK
jgi:hypothetical protein